MSNTTSNCDRNQLRQLLDGTLPDTVQATLTSHLESCVVCRSSLEDLAADQHMWSETRDALSGLVATGDLSGADVDSADSPSHVQSIPLDFLSPSDNPAMLGKLGDFEILEEIGCGGMGIVLKGYDHELNRFVAVKVLHPFCATSAAARLRFAREAQAAAAVVHQHVVAIHAVDPNHYPPYLVMPFIPGESLQQRLSRQGPFSVIDTLRIGQQVAEGLAAAHAQGLVHRDIKPGNILLERNVERVLLTDFGLARAADDASLTRSGVIAGTPQYMSPEQARGDQIDHRTDLFSLGSVLYTLLAGHSPFRAESAMAVLRRVCDDTPRPLQAVNPLVPSWLEALIGKLQAKHPTQRYETAAEVAELLKAGLAHLQQPTLVPLPNELRSLAPSIPKPRPHIQWWLIGITLILVLTFFGLFKPPAPQQIESQLPWNDPSQPELKQLQQQLNNWNNDTDF
ncbi:serine/threonine-protein kinase [Schlesneria paludicola]|uniref:serine/threonine-protein kinase n=1 Tax=Schlesneria paludicola TaxID=360056 RepID=UPI00029AE8B5|nr:serine/threonine-protein kinase [Schlesneria paludicola]